MKHYEFSNHPAEKASERASARQADYDAQRAAYEAACDARAAESARKRGEAAAALRQGRLLRAAGRLFSSLFVFEHAMPPVPVMASAGEEERRWSAGSAGETLVAQALAQHLDDRWSLVSGYANARGEIDQVLIGPSGMLTLEVKYLVGEITVRGESVARTYHREGVLHRDQPITDNKGRSPVRQLTETTDCMLEALRPHWPHLVVRRVLVFAHHHGRLVQCEGLPADTYAMRLAQWDLAALAAELPVFDVPPVDALVNALHADHQANLRARHQREQAQARRGARRGGDRAHAPAGRG